jgi:hypothetical protein
MLIADPRKYVQWWLRAKSITIDERGGLSSPDKRDYFELFDTLILDYCQQIQDYNSYADKKIKGAPETNMRKALDELISIEMVKRRAEIFAKIKFSGTENLEPIERFVKAVTGKIEKQVVGVMAHFIWQIKRRLDDKDIVHHIMPILFGAQGGGKSLSVHKLFKPLTNLTLELSLTEVTDPRFYFSLNRNFVVVLDEMAGMKKADVDILKKQISASYNDVRKLNTNVVTKIKQNASFMGTTNRPVNELIFDTTGARRFYEIKALDKLDWETVNSIDYNALFQGIDETKDRGYLEAVLTEVQKDQESLIGIDELNAFMESCQLKDGTKEISSTLVYEAYKSWAEVNGIKNPINSVWFGRKISNKGIVSIKKKVKGKLTTYYMIDENSELHKKGYDPLSTDLMPWQRN